MTLDVQDHVFSGQFVTSCVFYPFYKRTDSVGRRLLHARMLFRRAKETSESFSH